MSAAPQPETPLCPSCGQPLAGEFCSHCGEERLDFRSLTVRHFFARTLHEVFELDGKIWRTLRALLLRPGFLAQEYCAGRRRIYVNPFRLLITAAIVYALATRGGLQVSLFLGPIVLSLAPAAVSEGTSISQTVEGVDRFRLLGALLESRKKSRDLESEAVRDKFHQRLEKFAEPLSFANVFMLALALYLLFGRKRRHFVEHGVFGMHFMVVALLTGLLFLPAPRLLAGGWGAAVLVLIFLVVLGQFVYLVTAIRRFYLGDRKGIRRALIASSAALLTYLLNSVFITTVQTLGAALALWTI